MTPKEQVGGVVKPKRRGTNVQTVQPTTPRRPAFARELVDSLPTFPLLPRVIPPTKPMGPKKWCVQDRVEIHTPIVEYYVDAKRLDAVNPADPFFVLQKNQIVHVLPLSNLPEWSAIVREETRYRNIDESKKDWVTTRIAGWVWNGFLEDYVEEFPNARKVLIPHQTKFSADGEQIMIVPVKNKKTGEFDEFDEFAGKKFNLCGELSIAYVLQKDIDTVIRTWRENSFAVYDKMIGEGNDKPLGQFEMDDIFRLFKEEVKFEYYIPDPQKEPARTRIPFAAENETRRASIDFQNKLKDFYLITNVRINTGTGELVPKENEERNHWVVVERITHEGKRVELYNPFPNKRQSYSFGEFYNAVGNSPNRGWWVARKPGERLMDEEPKTVASDTNDYGVAIDNQTPNPIDAEQYMFVEGESTKKNMLCGEFCVSFILTQSLEKNLQNWLTANQHQPLELWKLARILQAYGFNHRKYIVKRTTITKDPVTGENIPTVLSSIALDLDSNEEHFKSFSIDTVLKYWKSVQPTLYRSILSDGNDTGTGPEDLKTILKAYGYENEGDITYYSPPPGERLSPPGRDREKLKTHYLIGSVLIETLKGSLIRWDPLLMGNGKPKGTAFHWVVITKITPVENLSGGNGGWVELYNPFSNTLEEYSYKELWNSTTGPGMWVRREITPKIVPQKKESARIGSVEDMSGQGPGNKKGVPSKTWTMERLVNEIQKLRNNGKTDKQIPAFLFGKGSGGWSKEEIANVVARTSTDPGVVASRPRDELAEILKETFKLKEAPPAELLALLRTISKGDVSFVLEVVNTLREAGLLALDPVTGLSLREAPLPRRVPTSSARTERSGLQSKAAMLVERVASAIEPMFVAQSIEEFKNIRKLAEIEEQAARTRTVTHAVPLAIAPEPAYRVMWDWERVNKPRRVDCPDVYRCGQKENTNNGHYVTLTREWQFFWFDLCCKVVYGCYHYELTDERREFLAHKWTGVGGQTTAFTNFHGLDKWKNYVLNERMKKLEPMIYTLICGGASLAGTPVTIKKGKVDVPLLKVAHFDGRRPPPPVESINPYTDPRVFFATIITDNRIKLKDQPAVDAFAVIPFPQFDGMPVPVPIVATEDIYYPMKFLIPIEDGKKANPYFPSRPIVIP